jgi:outer membrane protein assembly factor BamB
MRNFGEPRHRGIQIGAVVTGAICLLIALTFGSVGIVSAHSAARSEAALPSAGADDWPTYLHDAQRSAASAEAILNTGNISKTTKLWAYKTGAGIAASAAIVGNTVYIGSWDGNEYALDAGTGALKWKRFLGQTTAPACNPPLIGVTSSAAVINNVVYVGGGDSNWYALDATTGAVLWSVPTGDNSAAGGHYNWSSPLIYNGYAYIGIASNCDAPLVQGLLLQVDLITHQIIHTFKAVPDGQVGGGVWTTPTLDAATNTIYVTTGTQNQLQQTMSQAMVALDATTLAVKSSWQVPPVDANIDSDSGNSAILVTDKNGNKLVAFTNKNGYVYAFPRNNVTNYTWKTRIAVSGECPPCGDGSVSSGAFANGTLFMAGGNTVINGRGYPGGVHALDPATGALIWEHGTLNPVIPAIAYANGLVFDGEGPTLEALDAATGKRLFSYQTGGGIYSPPAISNGRIIFGSLDGNVYALGLPATQPPPPPPDPNCPAGWTCQDINNPTPPGSETVVNGTWTVVGSGNGYRKLNVTDQFRYLSKPVTGDFQMTARLTKQTITDGMDEAGIMIRQTTDPGSPHYSAYYHLGGGDPQSLLVDYRTGWGQQSVEAQRVTPLALPFYIQVQRVGDMFTTATSNDGVNFTLIPGSTFRMDMPVTALAGLAVDAHGNNKTSTATFTNVGIGAPANQFPVGPTTPCPAGWNCLDVGNPSPVGDQKLAGGNWTVNGVGPVIGGHVDMFNFVWKNLAADGAVSARITAQQNTDPWTRAGLMLRQSLDPGSPYYAIFVTPGHGLIVQYRPTLGLRTYQIAPAPGYPEIPVTLPIYLKAVRWTDTTVTPNVTYYTAYTSTDGVTWNIVPWSTVALTIPGQLQAGMAAAAYANRGVSAVNYDHVAIAAGETPPPSLCPDGWTCGDVGFATPTGAQMIAGGTWTVQGGGNDIWDVYDQFYYISKPLAADGTISARVVSQTSKEQNDWAKAGVMLRATTDPGSPYYGAFVTPANGITIQYRATQGGITNQMGIPGAAPAYIEVARYQNSYTAYTSKDGVTWTIVAGSSVTLNMPGAIRAGTAVTSHNSGVFSQVVFDTIALGNTAPIPPIACPAGWTCAQPGNPTPAGTQTLNNGAWTIQGGGGDIYDVADQFNFVAQTLAADGTLNAHITAQTNTDPWAKAGLMLRQTMDAGSPYYGAFMTPGHGIVVQYRPAMNAQTVQVVVTPGALPTYLRVTRYTDTTVTPNAVYYTAYTSPDGVTWTAIAGTSVALNMPGQLFAGMAVTSHNTGLLSTVNFDTVAFGTNPPKAPGACVAGWTCADIGGPVPSGSQALAGGVWTIQGGGGDIWDTSDSYHFLWQTQGADGSVKARIASQTNTDPWAKAGLMMRLSADPGAPYYAVLMTPGNGLAIQYRAAQGALSSQLVVPGATPEYVLIARVGTNYSAYTSADGTTWTLVPGSGVALPNLTGALFAGMAITSHNVATVSTGVLDNMQIGAFLPTGAQTAQVNAPVADGSGATKGTAITSVCPAGWSCVALDAPGAVGGQSQVGGVWKISGSGGLAGSADQVRLVGQQVGDTSSVSAHITTQSSANQAAGSGVIMRSSAKATSAYYAVIARPDGKIVVQARHTDGGSTTQRTTASGALPMYIKITRTPLSGSISAFSAFSSHDGKTWTLIANSKATLTVRTPTMLAGLVVSSGMASVSNTAAFDHVTLSGVVAADHRPPFAHNPQGARGN